MARLPAIIMVTPGGLEHGGGIGRVIGYALDAWASKIDPPVIQIIDSRGPGSIIFSPMYLIQCLVLIMARARERPLVHVNVAGRGSTIRKILIVHLSWLVGLPIVLHLHDYDYTQSLQRFPKFIRRAIVSMFCRANRVVVLSTVDRDLAVSTLGVSDHRVEIVSNAVPAPALERVSNRSDGRCQLLFLGNPSRRKGVHDLIEALGSDPVRGLDWRMTIAGGGAEAQLFLAQAHETGIGDQVTFPGWLNRDDTAALLRQADVLILPSYAEGMAMAVLEGISYGLCVVCTPVGGLAEVIEDGVSGLFVKPGDVEALAKVLAACVTDAGLRARLGAEATALFKRRFDSSSYPNRMEAIYHAAIADLEARTTTSKAHIDQRKFP